MPQVSHTNHFLCECVFMLCFSSSFHYSAVLSPGLRIDQFTANWARFPTWTLRHGSASSAAASSAALASQLPLPLENICENYLLEKCLAAGKRRSMWLTTWVSSQAEEEARERESFRQAEQVQLVSWSGNCTTWNQLVCANSIAQPNNSRSPRPARSHLESNIKDVHYQRWQRNHVFPLPKEPISRWNCLIHTFNGNPFWVQVSASREKASAPDCSVSI